MLSTLITGSWGKLGSRIRGLMPDALAPNRMELDVTNFLQVNEYLEQHKVETIVHCAAMTSVERCERERPEAYGVNVEGTRNLLSNLDDGGYLVYISTACVFRGDEPEKYYTEDDPPYPKNFYGITKLIAEQQVACSMRHKSLIVRTNFIERGKWPYPQAFTDRYANYLYSDQVAEVVMRLMGQGEHGLLHICGDRRMSMYDYAKLTDLSVKPMTLSDYKGTASLTVNMCLASKWGKLYKLM